MYLEYFKLKEYPFGQALNTAFYYQLHGHQEALSILLVSLEMNDGIIKVTGKPGSGKTLICTILLEKLDASYKPIFLPNPYLSQRELMQTLSSELNVSGGDDTDTVKLSKKITKRLMALKKSGKKVVLIFDEAQSLSNDNLDFIRILSNLENGREKLIQLVLVGGLELDQRLQDPHLKHFAQRITFSYTLSPMRKEDITEYIMHRIACVSGTDKQPISISPAASKLIHTSTGGSPRLINVVCHKALMLAYSKNQSEITLQSVSKAILDTNSVTSRLLSKRFILGLTLGAITLIAISFSLYTFW